MQMSDDEVKKFTEYQSKTSTGDVNGVDIEYQPGKSEITMIEDFSSKSLEELQSSFGIYQEALPKYRIHGV